MNPTETRSEQIATPDIAAQLDDLADVARQAAHWLTNHVVQIFAAVAVGVILYLCMALLRKVLCRPGRPADSTSFLGVFRRTFARTTHMFMAILAAWLVAGYAHTPMPVLNTVRFLFTVAAAVQGAIWARELVLGLIERRTGEEGSGETLSNAMGLIRVLVTFALFAGAAIMVLDNLGVNVTGLVAGLGIGGIAIGLAAQGIFSDLFAALSIIFDRPFRQGDTIQYDTTTATVEHIGLKSTRLRSIDGEAKVISNANLLQKEITNYRDIEIRRYAMPIALVYQTPLEKLECVPEVLRQVIEGAGAEFVRAGFLGFGASSLDFELFFLVHGHDINDAAALRHKVGLAILKRFGEEGLEFAYPTQTTFTAAPDGTMIYPFARPQDAARSAAERGSA